MAIVNFSSIKIHTDTCRYAVRNEFWRLTNYAISWNELILLPIKIWQKFYNVSFELVFFLPQSWSVPISIKCTRLVRSINPQITMFAIYCMKTCLWLSKMWCIASWSIGQFLNISFITTFSRMPYLQLLRSTRMTTYSMSDMNTNNF